MIRRKKPPQNFPPPPRMKWNHASQLPQKFFEWTTVRWNGLNPLIDFTGVCGDDVLAINLNPIL
jgi:hypothetical protein